MHFTYETAIILSLISFASTAPSGPRFVVHERRDELPHWHYQKLNSRNHEEATIPMKIAMAQRNLHRGYEFLMDVSHPTSENFGKHWTAQQVHDMFSPNPESVDLVKEWLVDSGIDPSGIQHAGATKWIQFNATIREAETLLKTKYHAYANVRTGKEHISCDHYSVPEHLTEHIELISPTTSLTSKHRQENVESVSSGGQRVSEEQAALSTNSLSNRASKLATRKASSNRTSKANIDLKTDLSNCHTTLEPQCIKALYKFPDGDKASPGNELGIAEWIDTLDLKGLDLFRTNFTTIPDTVNTTVINIDGGEHARSKDANTSAAHTESALDFQVTLPIIYPQTAILYQVGDDVQGQDFDDLLLAWDADFAKADGGDNRENNIYPTPENFTKDPTQPSFSELPNYKGFMGTKQIGGAKRPNVYTNSYGLGENIFSVAYQNRQCNEYLKLGLMGTTVIFATGDSGVGSQIGCIPTSNDTASVNAALAGKAGRFVADFPANCPYVTAVGGTMLKPGKGVEDGEISLYAPTTKNVTLNLAGGGAFSEIFPRPEYQKAAVEKYLKDFPPPYNSTLYNNTGRAYPDISAAGLNLTFIIGPDREIRTTGFGTSIAAPIVAGLITRINEERLAAGKGVVGFINPVIYANPEMLNDIVEGSNPGCGTVGFNATKGWDPATGNGTPNYEKMLKVFMALP